MRLPVATFTSYPALIWLGIPLVSANATTLTALPGYIASAWAFKKEINKEKQGGFIQNIGHRIIGGCIGALLLLNTSDRVFSGIVPHLMLFATALFAFGPKLIARIRAMDGWVWSLLPSTLIKPVYGGYFNKFGIMLQPALPLLAIAIFIL